MQHSSRMRIKGDYRSRYIQLFGALDDAAHDLLMSKMQSIEHAKGQDSRRVDRIVIYFAKNSHRMYVTQADSKRSGSITQTPLNALQTSTLLLYLNLQAIISYLDIRRQMTACFRVAYVVRDVRQQGAARF